jgi:hypothetical protein
LQEEEISDKVLTNSSRRASRPKNLRAPTFPPRS